MHSQRFFPLAFRGTVQEGAGHTEIRQSTCDKHKRCCKGINTKYFRCYKSGKQNRPHELDNGGYPTADKSVRRRANTALGKTHSMAILSNIIVTLSKIIFVEMIQHTL